VAPVDLDDPLGQVAAQVVAARHHRHGALVLADGAVVVAGLLQRRADAGDDLDPLGRVAAQLGLGLAVEGDRVGALAVLQQGVAQVDADLDVAGRQRQVLLEPPAGAVDVVGVEGEIGEGAEQALLGRGVVAGAGQRRLVGGRRLGRVALLAISK